MFKRLKMIAAGLLALPLCCVSCANKTAEAGTKSAATDTGPVTVAAKTETEKITEKEAETEAPSPYRIADACRIDFAGFDEELFSASFQRGTAAVPALTESGVLITADKQSRDPGVYWNINSMFKAAGYEKSVTENNVPFTPDDKKVIVLKVSAEWGGAFEMFYVTGTLKNVRPGYSITAIYGGDSEFFGERKTQYLIFEATKKTSGWKKTFNDGFRLDYTNYVEEGDKFLLISAAFCADVAEAEAYIAEDKGEETPKKAVEQGYYVCLYENRLDQPKGNVKGSVYQSLDEAKAAADKQKKYGYRVADENGNVVYTPYSQLQCDLLREGHYITEYARKTGFKYGDSCTNPGINHRPLRTSCDRLVDWILYRAGFTDQPLVQGCVVSNLVEWCKEKGFKTVTKVEDLQTGDIIFVRPDKNGSPQHVFMLASDPDKNGNALRYDHGSDTRINSKQPTKEPVDRPEAAFICAYRPVANSRNNIYYK